MKMGTTCNPCHGQCFLDGDDDTLSTPTPHLTAEHPAQVVQVWNVHDRPDEVMPEELEDIQ